MALKEKINTSELIDLLTEIDPLYEEKEIKKLEKKYNCYIVFNIEKHNSLQFTYYYDVDFGLDENFFIEIENGINNGTQVNNSEWDFNTKEETKIVEVLKDIVLDSKLYIKGSFEERRDCAILKENKNKLFELHRKNNYDNYVTGGNSKIKIDKILSRLKLTYIYDQIEVNRCFI